MFCRYEESAFHSTCFYATTYIGKRWNRKAMLLGTLFCCLNVEQTASLPALSLSVFWRKTCWKVDGSLRTSYRSLRFCEWVCVCVCMWVCEREKEEERERERERERESNCCVVLIYILPSSVVMVEVNVATPVSKTVSQLQYNYQWYRCLHRVILYRGFDRLINQHPLRGSWLFWSTAPNTPIIIMWGLACAVLFL